jgi:3-hydroxybutyryl-CoA dehydratase
MQADFFHTFTAEETRIMADLIGDHNPFHYEGEFIKKTRFKKAIMHGLLVGGMIIHFGGDLFPRPGCLAETIEFKFLRPVFFGDRVHAYCEITEVDREQKRVTFEMNCFNDQGENVVWGRATCISYLIEVSD